MNISIVLDKVTIIRKKGDDYKSINVPVDQSRTATIARLRNNPNMAIL